MSNQKTFATFGEAFTAAMLEASDGFADRFYACEFCGNRREWAKLVRTPDRCGSVCPGCIAGWCEARG